MKNRRTVLCMISLVAASLPMSPLTAAEAGTAAPYLQAKAEDVARWREWKFGLLISWGPVSVTGKELSWSRQKRQRFGPGEIPVETYDRLYTRFNPTQYDARKWVEMAEAAGVRYMIYVTKHHDGFCNFDSKLTDYKITSPASPYGKDIVKQLADACHRAGMKFGVYYSQPDWHHPDCYTGNHARYLDYYHGQIRELLSNYGQVDILWFDCLGYGGYFGRDAWEWGADAVLKAARQLQPHIVVNNRCGVPADFETPEQTLGQCNFQRAWESVITLGGAQWSWLPEAKLMSRAEIIRDLVSCACGDGNLLLGIGPMPDGRIEPRQVERLAEVGRWLKQCGASIYGTRGGPLTTAEWGGTTWKDDTVYVHVLKWPGESLVLPPIERKIVASKLLSGGGPVRVEQDPHGIRIWVAAADRREIDTIIALKLDGAVPKAREVSERAGPWSREKAWEWYKRVAPIAGCNFLPRTAVNSTEMWQKETFDPRTIDQELGWAQQSGYNSVRVFLQYVVWKADPQGFKKRLAEFLAIAERHKIRPLLVPFCDCSFSGKEPYLGRQDDPVPGVHNSGWVPSPGLKRVTDRAAWPDLQGYIQDVVGTFGQDDRVLLWDLYNEPGASNMGDKSLPLVEATFAWARAAGPKQPLTMGAWIDFGSRMSRRMMELSDVVSFHGYDGPEGLEKKIQILKSQWRPIICTECLAREVGSTFDSILPIFARDKLGWYNWGLVAGRTQTYIHWGSRKGSPEPKIWQHDVLHPDGRPYDPREITLIRTYSTQW
jgi:alpha-L-fucosidase